MLAKLLQVLKIDVMDYPKVFLFIMNSWPPYLGAGIRVREIRSDWKHIQVSMGLCWYNRNYVNSHFGGSLFAMTDPFYMLMLLRVLGKDYIVWDLSAKIKFLKPGKSKVTADFRLDDEKIAGIRERAETESKVLERFKVEVFDDAGIKIAVVDKTVYISKKKRNIDT